MENKKVGWLILGIGCLVSAIVVIFHNSTKKLALQSCPHAYECTMNTAMNSQYIVSLVVVGLIFLIGLYIMFSKPDEKIIEKKVKIKEKKKLDLTGLDKREKHAIKLIENEGGVIFQADLKEKMEIGKVGLTRLLDKLEAKGLLERKRRGMNNVVVLNQ